MILSTFQFVIMNYRFFLLWLDVVIFSWLLLCMEGLWWQKPSAKCSLQRHKQQRRYLISSGDHMHMLKFNLATFENQV